MRNYKVLKSASKASVQKVKVVDAPKVDGVEEVKYKEGDEIPEGKKVGDVKIEKVNAREEKFHEELQVITKSYDPNTGEAQDDIVKSYSLLDVKGSIDHCKSAIAKLQAEQADLEQLEKDLKAL